MTSEFGGTTKTRAGRPPGRRWRVAIAALGAVGMLAGVLTVLVGRPTSAPAVPAAVSTTLTPGGYPEWYSDEAGVRLAECVDPADVHCALLPTFGVFDTSLPTVFPTNYPDEAFYFLAESDPIPTPGCAGTRPGDVFVVLALEQAFTTDVPTAGAQIVFGRVRIRARGLCPNTPYTFTHPYGQITLTTAANGSLTNTVDIGCPDTATTCDFSAALASPVLKNFLRWDPAVAPAVDPGYLGNPNIPHRIVGATFNPGTGPANYFQVQGAGIPVLRTNLFSVAGKLAGKVEATPVSIAAGDQRINTTSAPRTITLTNNSATPATVTTATFAPAGTGFAVVSNNCAASLAPTASCTVGVAFTPTSVGVKTAALTIATSTGNVVVDLTGTGTAPAAVVTPPSVAFAAQAQGSASASQTVTVRNGGTAPLSVTGATVAGVNPADFVVTNNCTVAVAPAGTCTVSIVFLPGAAGARAATLTIATDGGTSTVALSGTANAAGGGPVVPGPVVPAGPCPPTVTGWWGQYFPNNNLTGLPTVCRNEPTLNFNWGTGSPAAGIPANNFSSRWTRTQNFATAGTYTFSARADNGVRLSIDGVRVIDDWTLTGTGTRTANVALTAGDHLVVMEHREGTGSASAGLTWALAPNSACPATIAGWKGEYWSNITLAGAPLLCRDDAALNFNWGNGSPAANISVSTFSARWTRSVNFTAGTYTFSAGADDAVRLYVDGVRVIDSWVNGTYSVRTVDVALTAGNHTIMMEFYENGGSARADLSWIAKATPAGLQASWFPNLTLTGTPSVQRVQAPAFSYGAGVAPVVGFPTSNWSVRFTGSLVPTATGNTVIRATNSTTDQVRVWVNNVLVIDNFGRPSAASSQATVALTASAATSIRVEFADPTDVANLALSWQLPGTTTFVAIPATQFRPL